MKVYIEVKLVGNGRSYEYEVSDSLKVGVVKGKIIKDVLENEENKIMINSLPLLCKVNQELILSDSLTLKEQNIKTGDVLLLL